MRSSTLIIQLYFDYLQMIAVTLCLTVGSAQNSAISKWYLQNFLSSIEAVFWRFVFVSQHPQNKMRAIEAERERERENIHTRDQNPRHNHQNANTFMPGMFLFCAGMVRMGYRASPIRPIWCSISSTFFQSFFALISRDSVGVHFCVSLTVFFCCMNVFVCWWYRTKLDNDCHFEVR